ncbi:hypothetical protein WA026_006933, partial [Henosepilachna vigintioctopunctata]
PQMKVKLWIFWNKWKSLCTRFALQLVTPSLSHFRALRATKDCLKLANSSSSRSIIVTTAIFGHKA